MTYRDIEKILAKAEKGQKLTVKNYQTLAAWKIVNVIYGGQ